MGPLAIGLARCEFATQAHGLPIALQQVIRQTHLTKRTGPRKWIEADVCLQCLDRSRRLARIMQCMGVSIIDEIGVEREGSLKFGDGGVVLALPKQDISKLSASLWQAGVEVHRRLRQFKRAIECSGTEIIAIERFEVKIE